MDAIFVTVEVLQYLEPAQVRQYLEPVHEKQLHII